MSISFTVCIPAYNRKKELFPLLTSILEQKYPCYDVLICEDNSPERSEIRNTVDEYRRKYPHKKITYIENEKTLGFDGNIRKLVDMATGEYCFFMGNDDIMAEGALDYVAQSLSKYQNIGVVLRTFAAFDHEPSNIDQVFRYFKNERFFKAGNIGTIVTFFKRCVVIPGVTIHREEALKFRTEDLDGTLLYQIYLVANILMNKNGVFLPQIITYYRNGGVPEFGNSEKEKGKFSPKERTVESSICFMRGMLNIAKYVSEKNHVDIYNPILKDLSNYSYAFLVVQASKGRKVFIKYVHELMKLGFGKSIYFYLYSIAILIFGVKLLNKIIAFIKMSLGYTPKLGNLYSGEDS